VRGVSVPALALIAYLVFAAAAFGWRTWLQVRRTGDTGFRGFSKSGVAKTASLLFVLGLLAAPLAPLAVLLGRAEPAGGALTGPAVRVAGFAAFALGFALTVAAQVQMGASWRIGVQEGERTDLVRHGVFAWMRNPIFTGMLLALAGMLLLVPGLLSLAALVCSLVGLELQVRAVEEPHLRRSHDPAYLAYAGRVGRFVPGVGRLRV
jgi:protein-S-isoprenylcysteine O-methyltransferase Ste14